MMKGIRFSLQVSLLSFLLLDVCCAQSTERKMQVEYLSGVEEAGGLFSQGQEVGVMFVSRKAGGHLLSLIHI